MGVAPDQRGTGVGLWMLQQSVLELARQGLPLASAAMQMFLAASGLGHGAADDSQVIRAYRALNGAQAGGAKK